MIIITLCGLLALSIEGILSDAASSGGAQNLQKKQRRIDISVARLVHFLDDPQSHDLIRYLIDQHKPIRFQDGHMILREAHYDNLCLPILTNNRIGSFFPRFEDCREYLVRISANELLVERCPRNSIFDPTSSTCIIFHKLIFIPYSCLQKCPDNDEEPTETDDLEESVPDIICSNYNSDGTMRESKLCVSVFGDPKYLERSSGMLDSLPTESVEETSTDFGPDDYSKYPLLEFMPLLTEPLLEDDLDEDQRMGRFESEAGSTDVLANKRNSKTLMTGDPLHKTPATKGPTRNPPTRNPSIKKPIGKNYNLQKLVHGSGMNEVSGDELNYSSGEEYSDYSGAYFDVTRD